jgi:hypothetical protein
MADDQATPAAPFDHFNTEHLRRLRTGLANPIPGDPTFHATVAQILRALLDIEIRHPKRIERDKAEAEKARVEAEKKAADDMKARHEQEQAALPLVDGKPEPKAKADLDKKQAAEIAAVATEKQRLALQGKQADERKALADKQASESAPPAVAGTAPAPRGSTFTGD